MADKIEMYNLLDVDGNKAGILAIATTAGKTVSVSQSIRLIPGDDPTKAGQWVLDKLNEELNV